MRFALPSFGWLKRRGARAAASGGLLAPEWLIALSRAGEPVSYRIHTRWDGRRELIARSLPPGKPWLAVIDATIPLRRKLQRLPLTARARQAMLAAAPDEFPLAPEHTHYALGISGSDGYLYALSDDELHRLPSEGATARHLLVGTSPLGPEACLAALQSHQRLGPAVDFLRRRPRLARWKLRAGLLGGVLLMQLGIALPLLLNPGLLDRYAADRARDLRRQAADLPQLYTASETMAASREAAAQLFARPEARLPQELSRLFAAAPHGHAIRRIELADGVLRVAGSGPSPQAWLIEAGFPPEGIRVETIGNRTNWSAERKL
jgi:hypothetical protein